MNYEHRGNGSPEYEIWARDLYEVAEGMFERRKIPSRRDDIQYQTLDLTGEEIDAITPFFQQGMIDTPLSVNVLLRAPHTEMSGMHALWITTNHIGEDENIYITTYQVHIDQGAEHPIRMHKDRLMNPAAQFQARFQEMITQENAPLDEQEVYVLKQMLLAL